MRTSLILVDAGAGRARNSKAVEVANGLMDRVSEYYLGLSTEAKARYTSKVIGAGLRSDPYTFPKDSWVEEPDEIPNVSWSDLFVYMISTPSPYTQEELKAIHTLCIIYKSS